MRFYLDEDLSDVIALIGRERIGPDVACAHELGMEEATDEEQLTFAAQERRCIVTRNARDFLGLTERFLAESLPHAGVAIVPPSLTGQEFRLIAQGLAYCHNLYPEDAIPYLVVYLSDTPPTEPSG